MYGKREYLPQCDLFVKDAYRFGRAEAQLVKDALSGSFNAWFDASMNDGCFVHVNNVSRMQHNVRPLLSPNLFITARIRAADRRSNVRPEGSFHGQPLDGCEWSREEVGGTRISPHRPE